MSANFAAIFRVRCSPPPPTRIGGPPGWTGRGTFSASSIRWYRPVKDGRSSVNIARAIVSASSRRSIRSRIGGKS